MSTLGDACAELNDSQIAAMDVEGHCVVIAPPGSGKTKLLVTRLAALRTSGGGEARRVMVGG
ncbi:UvrD-helicase domain-containing protein [Microbacterium helvum]